MANSNAMCTSFKRDLLNGVHVFGTGVIRASTAADTFRAALYLTTASIGASTTAYSATGEVSGINYAAGGVAVVNGTPPAASGTTAYWTPTAAFLWPTVTLAASFDAVLVYNSSQSNKAVSTHTFGPQTVTAGNFSLTMPVNDGTNALLRIS